MILYNPPSYFKSGEINSCRLSPLPTPRYDRFQVLSHNCLTLTLFRKRLDVITHSVRKIPFRVLWRSTKVIVTSVHTEANVHSADKVSACSSAEGL